MPVNPAIDAHTRTKELQWEAMQAIRAACRATHKEGAGGQAICICGASCGGSASCRMLKEFVGLVQCIPTSKLPSAWRKYIEELREVV
jgi:hypothetical protein